jgi:hypothetical protein
MIRINNPFGHLPLNKAETLLTSAQFRIYKYVWNWSAPRFHGAIGRIHDDFYAKHGKEKYYNRINRIRQIFGMKPYPYYTKENLRNGK